MINSWDVSFVANCERRGELAGLVKLLLAEWRLMLSVSVSQYSTSSLSVLVRIVFQQCRVNAESVVMVFYVIT